MKNKQNTNSPLVAVIATIGVVISAKRYGRTGVYIYVAGFLVGGVGTIININRAKIGVK